jgi:hypothetical protein
MLKPMTGDEYAKALKRLGFSNRNFCLTVIGVGDNTGRKWIAETSPIPGSVACLLRLALALKLDAIRMRELLKIG